MKPKSAGSPSAIDVHCCRRRRRERYTPWWFCAYIRSPSVPAGAILCTHCPNSGYGSGMNDTLIPALCGCQVSPPSVVE